MARLYADEHFPLAVVKLLCVMGHNVLTVQEAGNANLGIPDAEVLAFAIQDSRAVLTINRRDFVRLHFLQSDHCGIIVCSDDRDKSRMAERINQAISAEKSLQGKVDSNQSSSKIGCSRLSSKLDRPLSSHSNQSQHTLV